MGITEFSKRRARSKVHYLWPDIPAEALRVLELNGYEPVAYDEAVLSDPVALAQTDSFLIVQIKDKPTRIYAQLEKICSAALPHDCRVYVHPVPLAEDVDRLRMRKVLVNSLDSLKLRAAGLTADEESRMGRWLGGPSLAPLSPAVAAILLKKSCNDEDFSKEATNPRALPRQEVRALAYVLAESILVAITSSPP